MNYRVVTALLALAALPAFAATVSFPECPAVGLNTTGCELLITVTAVDSLYMANYQFCMSARVFDLLIPLPFALGYIKGILRTLDAG